MIRIGDLLFILRGSIFGIILMLIMVSTGSLKSLANSQDEQQVHLVAPNAFLQTIEDCLPPIFQQNPIEALDLQSLINAVAKGEGLVWIGPPDGLPPDLWIGSFNLSSQKMSIQTHPKSPIPIAAGFDESALSHSAYLASPTEFPKHNIDEEIRADFLPILEAKDRFGTVIGYPGVLFSHVAPSLAGNRFYGSQCYFFFFEQPEKDITPERWLSLLNSIAFTEQSKIIIERIETNYASYYSGERVQVRVRIRNKRASSAAMQIRFYQQIPGSEESSLITDLRRVAGAESITEALCDYRPSPVEGLHRIRIDIAQDPETAEKLAVAGNPRVVARREIGFVLLEKNWKTKKCLSIEDHNFLVDGKAAFFAGTHYYPSNSWWEWAWRDFRPAMAARDFQAMRKAGYRIVRVWVDPVLDEIALRAMDAAIWLAGDCGITLDICIFNQWIRDLGYEQPDGKMITFEFRHPADFNLYSFSLRHLPSQKEYLQTLARRWKRAGNIIYNLANETYVKDPDCTQMDPEAVAWPEAKGPSGARRDTLLFRRWSDEMTKAMREVGAGQIVFPGYLFSLSEGGDTYLANEHAPLLPWHGYFPPEWIGQTIHYFDPLYSRRPLLLEEFGSLGWNNAAHYDAAMHYALGAGAGAAMSYEWGVSWLSPEAPYVPLPLRDVLTGTPDSRWFAPAIEYALKNTTESGTGIAPWPSGFGYSSIYHGTPFPAQAAQAVWRMAEFGERFPRAEAKPEEVYVYIPDTTPTAITPTLPLFKELWLQGIRFGVWRGDFKGELSTSAKVLLLAGPVSPGELAELRSQAGTTVQVYESGDYQWKLRMDLPRVMFNPQGHINCLIRPTQTGHLYMFASGQGFQVVSAQVKGCSISAGLEGFLMVHTSERGIDFVEAAGEVRIDNTVIFNTTKGRLLTAAQENQALNNFGTWQVIATEPTEIRFGRPLHSAQVFVPTPDGKTAVPLPFSEENTLLIDDELIRYMIEISFTEGE